jgi:hypothetical protein
VKTLRDRPINNCSHFLKIHLDSLYPYDISQKLNLYFREFTLEKFGVKFILSKTFENQPHVFLIFLDKSIVNADIIEIRHIKYIQIVFQRFVNIGLESNGYINQIKKYHYIFIVFVPRAKRNFPFIAKTDPYPIIDIFNIQLSINSCIKQFIYKFSD